MDKSLHKMVKIAYGLGNISLTKADMNPVAWKEPE